MQSTRKTSISPRPRTANCTLPSKNSPRKKHASVQTDDRAVPFEDILEFHTDLKDGFPFDERTRKSYTVAVNYLNRVHSCMNRSLYEKYGECGDTEPEANNFFKLPNIPNYSTIYLMLLEKTRPSKIPEESYKTMKKKDNIERDLPVPGENTQDVLKRSNGLNIRQLTLPLFETTDTEDEFSLSQEPTKFHTTHTQENINYVKQVVIFSKTNSFAGEERVIESNFENENYSEGSDKEGISYLDVIQNEDDEKIIYEEQSEIEDSVTYITNSVQEKDDSLISTNVMAVSNENNNLDNTIIMDVIKQRVQEEFLTYLNTANMNNANNGKKPRLAKSNFCGVNIQPQINLLEYAQKKMERRNHFERETKSAESDRPQKIYFNKFLSGNDSMIVKPSSPEKVTDLFRKISHENFNVNDAKHKKQNRRSQPIDTLSDNDSVILDDEEFEKMSKSQFTEQKKMEEMKVMKIGQGSSEPVCEKSHPLKLNGKDMTKLNDKVLSAIGLFTERGDIRPGIIDILEKEKRAKAKDVRNKPFRGRRQWDLQVHLQPKNDMNSWTSVSTEKSFVTLSSDIKSDFETVKSISHQIGSFKR